MIEELRGPQPTYKLKWRSMEKQLQVWALKKYIRPVLLDTLADMYATCIMFLMHSFLFSASPLMISAFKKSTFLKTKTIKAAEKEPY